MAHSRSRLTAEIDFDRDGKQHGFIRLLDAEHLACPRRVRNLEQPRVQEVASHARGLAGRTAVELVAHDRVPGLREVPYFIRDGRMQVPRTIVSHWRNPPQTAP